MTKAPYSVYELSDNVIFESDDYIIIALVGWTNNEAHIEQAFKSANEGAKVFIGFTPMYDDYFLSKKDIMGITEVKDTHQSVFAEGFVVTGDVMLGLRDGDSIKDSAVYDTLYDVKVNTEANVYLKTEDDVPIYYTLDYGEGN